MSPQAAPEPDQVKQLALPERLARSLGEALLIRTGKSPTLIYLHGCYETDASRDMEEHLWRKLTPRTEEVLPRS